MTGNNNYLDGLMADCRRSVQCPPYQPQQLHFPQYFARPPNPPPPPRFHSFKGPQAIAPQPCISGDLTAIAAAPAAYTPRNVLPPANAPRPYISIDLPLPTAGPQPDVPKKLPPTETAPPPLVPQISPVPAAAPHPDVNKDVPPAANAPRPAIPKNVSLAAPASSPFVPVFQFPIANSISTCALQKTHEPTIPNGHAESRQNTHKGCIKEEPKNRVYIRYKNLDQLAMRKELKARGLLTGGPNADLIKRLEKDDEFQAKPRTAENYETMNQQEIHSLCSRRSIPSQGTLSLLKDRLKAHDKRVNKKVAAVPSIGPVNVPNGPFSALKKLDEKPLVPTVKKEPPSRTERPGVVEETAKIASAKERVDPETMKYMLSAKSRRTACSPCRKRRRRCVHERPKIVAPSIPKKCVASNVRKTAEIVAPSIPKKCVESSPMRPKLSAHPMHRACSLCRSSKRRCVHDEYGEVDLARANEPPIPRPTACKGYIKDRIDPIAQKPTPDIQEVAPKNITRLRLSQPKVMASQNDKKPGLAVEEVAGSRVTRSHLSNPKASASQNELRSPARIRLIRKDVKKKDDVSKPRRTQLLYQPKDEITLLQLCVKLKDVIAWGNIHGFWTMVQDTLQMKTGKPYKRVNRHVRVLVRNRRAEQREIKQRGKISIPRVSAGCRPLLDKWIAGGNQKHNVLPNTSTTPTSIEDKDDMSLGEEGGQQLDSDEEDMSLDEEGGQQLDSHDSALEVQKRSATDAWLDTSCDTTRRKKLKICTSELHSDISKSCADSIGCWSLSGSSVTSESSLEDESEDEDEDNMKLETNSP